MSHAASFNVELFLGPQVVITILSAFLVGVATVQAHDYYRTFRSDRALLRIVAGVAWSLDFINMALNSAGFYILTVRYFGHPEKFITVPKVLFVAVFFASGIYMIVQGFFSHRVWAFTRMPILGALCCFLTLLRVGFVFALGGTAIQSSDNLLEYSNKHWWLLTLSIIAAVIGDTLTSVSLSWSLWQKRDKLFDGSGKVVDRLILWTLQTGVLVSMTTITLLVCFLTMSHNWIWISILFIVPRLYTVSLFSSLNGRKALRQMKSGGALQLSLPSSNSPTRQPPPISIEMRTSTIQHTERELGTHPVAVGLAKANLNCASNDGFGYGDNKV